VKRKKALAPRKTPKQARSREMEALIHQAAVRVLAREGAAAFTTTRVAVVAGISVGSLYQYYPNKAALLFRLQADEMERTWAELAAILADRARPPAVRFRAAIHRYFETESEESALRRSLRFAELHFDDAPEARAIHARAGAMIAGFLAAALPRASQEEVARATEMVAAVVIGVAEQITRAPLAPAELRRWSDAVASMLARQIGLPASRDATR
jgi:AcrR family transcriptional regulator